MVSLSSTSVEIRKKLPFLWARSPTPLLVWTPCSQLSLHNPKQGSRRETGYEGGGQGDREGRRNFAFSHVLIFCEVRNFGLFCLLPLYGRFRVFTWSGPTLSPTINTEPTEDRKAWVEPPWFFADTPWPFWASRFTFSKTTEDTLPLTSCRSYREWCRVHFILKMLLTKYVHMYVKNTKGILYLHLTCGNSIGNSTRFVFSLAKHRRPQSRKCWILV